MPVASGWVTRDGLLKFERATQRFTPFTEREGLPGESDQRAAAGPAGEPLAEHRPRPGPLTPRTGAGGAIRCADGLQGDQFDLYSSFQNAQGQNVFGGLGGLTIFSPNTSATTPKATGVLTDCCSQ